MEMVGVSCKKKKKKAAATVTSGWRTGVSEEHCRQDSVSSLLSPQKLANSKAHTSRFISANLQCNKFKNRLVNIMPFESTRVCLQPIRGVEGSDYINASFIDGYRQVPASSRVGEIRRLERGAKYSQTVLLRMVVVVLQ